MKHRGQASIATLFLILLTVGASLFTFVRAANPKIERDKITTRAIAEAQEALIGWAAGNSTRPGILPCPDANNDGIADAYVSGDCPSYIGRLPRLTLGVSGLDANGDVLWYAVSQAYAKDPSCGAGCPLNSDTAATISVTGLNTETAAALIISPGLALNGQSRSDPTVRTAYLDGANNDGDTNYVSGLEGDSFNDRIHSLKADSLWQVVTRRVAKEAINALSSYRTTNGYLPRANRFTDASGNCNSGDTQGRLPVRTETCDSAITLALVTTPMSPWGANLPSWYTTNQWNRLTYYAVSSGCSARILSLTIASRASGCSTLDIGLLNLLLNILGLGTEDPIQAPYSGSITGDALAVVIVSGGQLTAHAAGSPCSSATDCFQDDGVTLNTDGNKAFVMPSRFPTTNDKMAVLCPGNSACAALRCPSAPALPCAFGL